MSDRTTNTVRNIFVGFIYRFIHILMPFVIRTMIINVLGKEYLGLNTLFTSIFTFLNLAEFGFTNALTFKMYKPAKEKDFEALSVYASVIRRVYLVVGLVILGAGTAVMPMLPHFINGECPSDVNIYILYFIYLMNTVIPYLGCGYCTSVFAAFQRIDLTNIINAVVTLALNLFQIAVLLITASYYQYIICLPVFTLFNNLFLIATKKRFYPEIMTNRKVSKDIIRETFVSASALFGHSLNYVVVSAADNVVISSFLGLAALALYGNYYTILSAVLGLIDIVIQSCTPSIGNLLLERNPIHTKSIFKTVSFLTHWITGWCSICLICLYQPFMRLWMGENMLLPSSTVILFSMYLYSYKARAAVIVFKDAAGMWKADWLKPYVSALANLIINILLVKLIGINGVLLSTIAVFCFINFPWESKALLKRILPDYINKYYVDFLKYCILNIAAASLTYVLCNIRQFESDYVTFFIRIVICLIFPNILYILFYHKNKEYAYLKDKIKKGFAVLIRRGR